MTAPAPDVDVFNPELFTFDPQADYAWRVFDRITIATVTFNRLEHTQRLVDSLLRLSQLPFDLLVIDNASEDGTQAWLRDLAAKVPSLQVVENARNVGKGRALLQIRDLVADGLLILFDNDIEILSNYWLVHLQKAFHALRLAGSGTDAVLGIRLLNCEEYGFRHAATRAVLAIPGTANALPRTSYAAASRASGDPVGALEEQVVIGWTDFLIGACMAMPAALFRRIRLEEYYPLKLGGDEAFIMSELARLGAPAGYIENGPVARHNDWPYSEAKIALYRKLTRERAVTDLPWLRWKLRRLAGTVLRRGRRAPPG